MRKRWLRAGAGALVAVALALIAATAAAASAGPVDRAFPGGQISQLTINDGPTQGSFSDLAFEFDRCGTEPGETGCTWQVEAGLAPDGFELCPSTLEAAKTIWSSPVQTANGTVASGPQTFALRGTPGQVLCVVLHHTSSGESSGVPFNRSDSSVVEALVMDTDLVTPREAAELKIIRAGPPAKIEPPALPDRFMVGPSCHALTIGTTRYVFIFHRIDCRTATNIANMAHLSGASPGGYRCKGRPDDGMRCQRRGHPEKYVEWHLPTPRVVRVPR
jgi:hypothetical protein